jgi:UDP-2,3-diacylglucosamine pyrophosphatase LpxH
MDAVSLAVAARARAHDIDPVIELAADRRYLLISDLHLGDGTRTDLFKDKETDFLEMLAAGTPAVDAVILAGDVLDAPQARRPEVIYRAHRPVVDALDRLSRRKPVYHILGNHDDFGFIARLLPTTILCNEIHLGDRARIIHGHQFDVHFGGGPLEGRGSRALRVHDWFERTTGHFVRLPFSDFDNPSNRFAHWFFYRVTMVFFWLSKGMAAAGNEKLLRKWAAHHDYWSRYQWGDSHALLIPALNSLARGRHEMLITGHSHQAGHLKGLGAAPPERVSGEPPLSWRDPDRCAPVSGSLRDRRYLNLGSWTFGECTYAVWSAQDTEIYSWPTRQRIDDRSYRVVLDSEAVPGMREWWTRYYRGFFRYRTERIRRDRVYGPTPMPESS